MRSHTTSGAAPHTSAEPASDTAVDTGVDAGADTEADTEGGTIRYWAAAKEAAGVAEEGYREPTLGAALEAARQRHSGHPEFARVLQRCSFLVDGEPAGTRDPDTIELSPNGTVEVLPPFAGG